MAKTPCTIGRNCRFCANLRIENKSFGYSNEGGCYSIPYVGAYCRDKRAAFLFKDLLKNDEDMEIYGYDKDEYELNSISINNDCPFFKLHKQVSDMLKYNCDIDKYEVQDTYYSYVVSKTIEVNGVKGSILYVVDMIEEGETPICAGYAHYCTRHIASMTGINENDVTVIERKKIPQNPPKSAEEIKEITDVKGESELEKFFNEGMPEPF